MPLKWCKVLDRTGVRCLKREIRRNIHFIEICNYISGTTWNLKKEVDAAPETSCVLVISQVIDGIQVRKIGKKIVTLP
jgi:hypothetical protein